MPPSTCKHYGESFNRCSDSFAVPLGLLAESRLRHCWEAQLITSTSASYHCSLGMQCYGECWDLLLGVYLCQLPYPSSVSLMMSQISMLRAQSSLRKDPSVALSGKQKPRQGKVKSGPGTLMSCCSAVRTPQSPAISLASTTTPRRRIRLQSSGHQVLTARCHHRKAHGWGAGMSSCSTLPTPPMLPTAQTRSGSGLCLTSASQLGRRGLICLVGAGPETVSLVCSH